MPSPARKLFDEGVSNTAEESISIDIYPLLTQSMLYEATPNISSELIPISNETPSSVISVLPASPNHWTFPRLNQSETNSMILADTPLRPTDAEFLGCPTLQMLKANKPGVSIKCCRKNCFPQFLRMYQ